MNILFVSISSIPDVKLHSISLDLLREFQRNNHSVSIICALEKDNPRTTYIAEEEGFKIVRVQIGGNKKAGLIEKGITTLTEPYKYIHAMNDYFGSDKFDLVIYPTPPVTQVKVVEYIKRRDSAVSYLLLKDIFPQNAVDIGLMSKNGIKGIVYRHFRNIEKKLYSVSDHIGCMSDANVKYLLAHNPEVDQRKVEVCPNCIEIIDKSTDAESKKATRERYNIPLNRKVFIYGGNLGKPQGIPFVLDCMRSVKDEQDAFFVIVGDGTEYKTVEKYINESKQSNLMLIRKLPKDEYDTLVAACDIGLIFLDYRFTIPNFPSRLLGYLQARLPVLAATDCSTDVGGTIVEGGFGWWCESNNTQAFTATIQEVLHANLQELGGRGFDYLLQHYSVNQQYQTIMKSVNQNKNHDI